MDWHIERLETCESTQDEMMERARLGAPNGSAIIAKTMGDGRGQHGRSWHAPEGGLYLSFVVRELQEPHLLTLALGNAVADVIEVAGADPQLKWVNDVWIDGKKVAGILVEGESTGENLDFLVAGIGLNVNGTAAEFPSPLNGQAVTLEDALGAENCMEDLEGFLLQSIGQWLDTLQSNPGDVVAAWQARDALRGQTIGFDPDGDFCTQLLGQAAGIDERGRILIDTDDGRQAFDSGSVFLQK